MLEEKSYSLSLQYGALFFTQFTITIPSDIQLNGIKSCIITPLAEKGLIGVSIINISDNGRTITGYIFNSAEGTFKVRLNVLISAY